MLLLLGFVPFSAFAAVSDKEAVTYANVVIFASFLDEPDPDYMNTTEFYDKIQEIYNADNNISLKGYLDAVSFGQMQVENIFPQANSDGTFSSITLPMKKTDLKHVNSDFKIIDYLLDNIPQITGENLDYDDNDIVDTLTIVINGDSLDNKTDYPTTWPHQGFYVGDANINGKVIGNYNFLNTYNLFERQSYPFGDEAGLVIHEYLHGFGYADLYTGTDFMPVGLWDIMAGNTYRPQYPLAFLRQAVSGWLTLPEYSQSAKNIRVVSQDTRDGNQAVILKSPYDRYEFFVVEYRKKGAAGEIDAGIDGDGLIVYRINNSVRGFANSMGETGVYIFRPTSGIHGYSASNDTISLRNAYLAPNIEGDSLSTRTQIGSPDPTDGIEDFALTYDNGSNSGIVISNIAFDPSDNNAMTFDVEIPDASLVDSWENASLQYNFSNSIKRLDSITHNDTLYTLTYDNKQLSLNTYSNAVLSTVADVTVSNVEKLRLFVYNNTIYAAYSAYNNHSSRYDINIMRLDNGALTLYNTVNDTQGGDFDVVVHDDTIYIAAVTQSASMDHASLFKINDSFVSDPMIYHSTPLHTLGGPRVISTGEKLYAFARTSILHSYEFLTENSFDAHSSAEDIAVNNYDIIAFNQDIYLLTGANFTSSNPTLYRYDGSSWTKSTDTSVTVSSVNMSVAQGNLYMLTSTSPSGQGDLVVFRYNREDENWEQEGTRVDVDTEDFKLTGTDTRLYVAYENRNSSYLSRFSIAYKDTSNSLLSITVTPPSKLQYFKGDAVSTAGMTVTANYTKEKRILDPGEYTITGFDTNVSGIEREATVIAYGFKRNFSYNVSEPFIPNTTLTVTTDSYSNSTATATLTDSAGKDYVVANVNGVFEFLDIAAGSYTLVTKNPGYLTHTIKEVDVDGKPIFITVRFIAGDVNGSATVDSFDLLEILNSDSYNKPTPSSRFDVNNDDVVNFNDLAVVRNFRNFNKSATNDSTVVYQK